MTTILFSLAIQLTYFPMTMKILLMLSALLLLLTIPSAILLLQPTKMKMGTSSLCVNYSTKKTMVQGCKSRIIIIHRELSNLKFTVTLTWKVSVNTKSSREDSKLAVHKNGPVRHITDCEIFQARFWENFISDIRKFSNMQIQYWRYKVAREKFSWIR